MRILKGNDADSVFGKIFFPTQNKILQRRNTTCILFIYRKTGRENNQLEWLCHSTNRKIWMEKQVLIFKCDAMAKDIKLNNTDILLAKQSRPGKQIIVRLCRSHLSIQPSNHLSITTPLHPSATTINSTKKPVHHIDSRVFLIRKKNQRCITMGFDITVAPSLSWRL